MKTLQLVCRRRKPQMVQGALLLAIFAVLCLTGMTTGAAAQLLPPASKPFNAQSANATKPRETSPALTVEEVRIMLQKPVHLMMGTVTLPEVTGALSAQTGLQIQPADYLRERRLVVQLDNVSASAALTALAELNDWVWSDKGGGQIVIARKLPLLRADPATIPLRARAALPKDIRNFCRIGPVYDHPSQPADKNIADHEDTMPVEIRPNHLATNLRQQLVASLKPGIRSGAEYPWERMTRQQQQDMTTILLFDILWLTNMKLRGDPLPYLADPTRAFLEMRGDLVSIMTRPSPDMRFGFGAQIKPHAEEQ